jgi:prefoldin subunit 5
MSNHTIFQVIEGGDTPSLQKKIDEVNEELYFFINLIQSLRTKIDLLERLVKRQCSKNTK